jgi:hypothetical protein
MSKKLRRAFFEDLGQVEDSALADTREAIASPDVPVWVESPAAVTILRKAISTPDQIDALATFVRDMVHVAVHSVLVAIDGGAASAEIGRVRLVDKRGVSLGKDLHQLYVDHLMDTSRIA